MSSAAESERVRRSVLVAGATGVVGHYLLPRLSEAGLAVQAISRRPEGASATGLVPHGHPGVGPGRVRWLTMDLARGGPADLDVEPIDVLLHAAPIWLLPRLLAPLCPLGLRRLVAFSSTSRFTKWSSASARERETARRLAQSEDAVESICRERGIAWTIFRPTLIYGGGRDRNVSAIARFTLRFGFVPVAGPARGARQPVHADDLARACVAVLDNPATFGKAYDLPGGETLTYAEMVARIARGLERKPRLLHVPPSVLRTALGLAGLLPGLAHLSPRMADRMNEPLAFDDGPARRDFGYAPRGFVFPEDPPRP